MLVGIVLSFALEGCEDGLESIRTPVQTSKLWTRLKMFGRPGTKFWYPVNLPLTFTFVPPGDGALDRDADRFKKTTKISFVFL